MLRAVLLVLLMTLCACGGGDGSARDAAPRSDGTAPPDANADAAVAPTRVLGYARAEPFPRLVLELDAVAGTEPRSTSTAKVIAVLDDVLDKPDGIELQRDADIESRGADYAWTDAELFELADATFDLEVPEGTTKIHVMTVDGHSARDDGEGSGVILGIAWSNTHLVLFQETIRDVCDAGLGPTLGEQLCAAAETSIWIHELGHVLGLVDVGAPMVTDHEDPEHSGHDVDDECVMYWAYEGAGLIDVLAERVLGGNSAALELGSACQADLAALREM